MICQRGGLTFIRNNELRELTVNWLKQHLLLTVVIVQELTSMHGASGAGDKIDVRVFHPNTLSYRQAQVASLFHRHELEKKQIFHSTCFLNFWWFIYLFKSFIVQSTNGPLVSCTSGQNYMYMNTILVSRYKKIN